MNNTKEDDGMFRFLIASSGIIAASMFCFALPTLQAELPSLNVHRLSYPTSEELVAKTVFTGPTPPIIIRFIPPSEIARQHDPEDYKHGGSRVVIAYSNSQSPSSPCYISLPSGMPIGFDRDIEEANFLIPTDAKLVAHEILHCLRWHWH